VARGLAARGVDRFAIALEDPGDILVLLAAGAASGSEPCVYPRGLAPEARADLSRRFDHETIIDDPEGLADLASATGPLPEPPPDRSVLVLTTGTTGEPKGGRHSWVRLIQALRRREGGERARWLLAYNLNQFGGLQVLLHVLVNRATLVAAASSRAQDVITALRDARVTHVSATPTFWRILVGGLDAETAGGLALEQITMGGEPVPEALIARLVELFPDARTAQIYGSTEAGTAVSVHDGLPGLPLSVLERDESHPVRLRIVDGELQMRSRVGMLGYHGTSEGGPDWRPTGDLVEIRDGRIRFVGRTSDIINVGGVKVHPLPVEEVVSAVPGVELVTAYGSPNPVTGQIVTLDVVPAEGIDTESLALEVRQACAALPAASRPRRIHFVEDLDIRGHKVRRAESR
jgi:acyl-CoA synthetase (AMP-forming)/AMP-acid ligase II